MDKETKPYRAVLICNETVHEQVLNILDRIKAEHPDALIDKVITNNLMDTGKCVLVNMDIMNNPFITPMSPLEPTKEDLDEHS